MSTEDGKRVPQLGRVSLVVEGGAMRTSYAAGALCALDRWGIRPAVKVASGGSAGALLLGCFLTGVIQEASDAFVESLLDRRFISQRRFWRMVDVDFLIDDVFSHLLQLGGSLEPGTELIIAVTEDRSAQPRSIVIQGGESLGRSIETFRASCAIPVLYGRRVTTGLGTFVDGGIADPIPLTPVLGYEADTIIVIRTRAIAARSGLSRTERAAIAVSPTVSRAVRRLLLTTNPLAVRTIELMSRKRIGNSRVLVIAPESTWSVDRIARDRSVVENAVQQGYADAQGLLESIEVGAEPNSV
jgi:predicted patatin/cPLA2 family phospholipase